MSKTTMQLFQHDKDKLEEKRKELGLANVAEVLKRLMKHLNKVKS